MFGARGERAVIGQPVPADVGAAVRALWAAAVGPSGLTTQPFLDSGGTSLSGLRLLGAVHKTLEVRVNWRDLTAAADADDFARRVHDQMTRGRSVPGEAEAGPRARPEGRDRA